MPRSGSRCKEQSCRCCRRLTRRHQGLHRPCQSGNLLRDRIYTHTAPSEMSQSRLGAAYECIFSIAAWASERKVLADRASGLLSTGERRKPLHVLHSSTSLFSQYFSRLSMRLWEWSPSISRGGHSAQFSHFLLESSGHGESYQRQFSGPYCSAALSRAQ